MHPRFDGRVALVTGASRGIGAAIARRLAAEGAQVVGLASPRSATALEAVMADIVASGGRARGVVADLAEDAAREGLMDRVAAAFGAVELLVNNAAGISAYASPGSIDLPARRRMLALNLDAPVDLIQQALPAMRTRGWGRILNIGSEMARQPPVPYPGPARFVHSLGYYGVSKAALHRYTEALAAELHGSGITANVLLPYKIVATEAAAAVVAQSAERHPDWIEPVEVMAEAATWLMAGPLSGQVAVSRTLLHQAQAPVHALDGRTLLGDALLAHNGKDTST